MADPLAIPLAAIAAHTRATNQLVADVQAIAADAFTHPATRPFALQLASALASAFPETAACHTSHRRHAA